MEAQDRDHLNLRMEKHIIDFLKDGKPLLQKLMSL